MVKKISIFVFSFMLMRPFFTYAAQELDDDIRESLRFISDHIDFKEKSKPSPIKWWRNERNELKIAALGLIKIYQRWISPQDTPSCNFSVTCSRFAWEAIHRYGIIGILMTADRLLRCHALTRIYYPYDPVLARSIDYPLSWYSPGNSQEN